MRVGLNALYLIPDGCGGIEMFAKYSVASLVNLPDGPEVVTFVSRAAEGYFAPIEGRLRVIVCPFDARNRVARYCWEQLVLPLQSMVLGVDVLHSLAYVGPIISPVPTVLTIHDANSQVPRTSMTRTRRAVLSVVSKLASKTADIVVTVSEFSRQELMRWYGLTAERVRIVSQGAGAEVEPCSSISDMNLNRLVSQGPYVAAIGGEYRHKNIDGLISAFSRIATEVPHNLIIAGKIADSALMRELPPRVFLAGYLKRSDLQELIRRCDLFVMPSFYEGFGLPVLEAQALGSPVACSKGTALAESTAGSAALFSPDNIIEMADVIKECIQDRNLNAHLRQESRSNVTRFSWNNAAREYLAIYASLQRKTNRRFLHALTCITRLT